LRPPLPMLTNTLFRFLTEQRMVEQKIGELWKFEAVHFSS